MNDPRETQPDGDARVTQHLQRWSAEIAPDLRRKLDAARLGALEQPHPRPTWLWAGSGVAAVALVGVIWLRPSPPSDYAQIAHAPLSAEEVPPEALDADIDLSLALVGADISQIPL